jgi:hypothetical protein
MQWFIAVPNSLTFREYYATQTMSEIKEAFDATGGRLAVSVGLHPAVAIANGIDSADGYFSAYPLEYKDRFRRLIAPALEASEENRIYFDNWGSRAYVFQPDLPRPGIYPPTGVEISLVLEPAAFDELDVTHVISSSPLNNAEAVGLELLLMSESSDELGPIWLYQVQ